MATTFFFFFLDSKACSRQNAHLRNAIQHSYTKQFWKGQNIAKTKNFHEEFDFMA